jgi:hypothetical protein
VTGGWGGLHNEEFHNTYSLPSIIRMIRSKKVRWAGNVTQMGRTRMHICYWWKDRKRPLGRVWHSWVDNIKMDLGELGWGGMDWIDVAQDRDQ